MSLANERMDGDLIERAQQVRLIVLDVDGVLTDGVIAIDEHGHEMKHFHVRDGSAVVGWIRSGGKVAILSGRKSRAVEHRARELGIDLVLQGNPQKIQGFHEILESSGVSANHACFVGDDLPDLPLFRLVGLAACPSDSTDEIREAAHFVSRYPGGRGAVQEVVSMVMKSQNLWQSHVHWYEQRS